MAWGTGLNGKKENLEEVKTEEGSDRRNS